MPTNQCVNTWCNGGNGAGGESSFPHTSTNAPLAVGILNRLRDCASLSTGTICTSVCTSVQCWRFNHLNTSHGHSFNRSRMSQDRRYTYCASDGVLTL